MLIGICGKMGSGKTLSMTILSQFFKLQGLDVYANYTLEGSKPLKKANDILKIENGIVSLDEFWITMDSRSWKNNVFLTHWINQTRKKNLIVMYTTQTFRQIDIRVRNATDYLIFCERIDSVITPPYHRLSIVCNATQSLIKTIKITKRNASAFFHFYNSFEVLKPLTFAKERSYNDNNNTYNENKMISNWKKRWKN